MTDMEKVITAIANSLTVVPADIMIVKLRTIASMLDRISTYQQADAVLAAFGEEDDNA